MAKQLTVLDYLGATDKFSTLFIRVNELVASLNTEVITANSTLGITSGNAFVNGVFGGVTLFANTALRGGNSSSSANLNISSNISLTGAKLLLANSSTININSMGINSTAVSVPTSISIGNSTVNVVITSSTINIGNTEYSNSTPTITVANNGTDVGTRKKLNFKPSNSVDLTLTDNVATDSIDVSFVNLTEPEAAGSNTYVQFNDGGTFGGTSGFVFDKTTNTVTIANNIIVDKVEFSNGGRIRSFSCSFVVNTSLVIDSFTKADFRAADYVIAVKDNSSNNYQTMKFSILHDGTNVFNTEYSSLYSNTEIASFTVGSNTTHVLVNCTSTSTNTTVKGFRTTVAV